MRTCSDDTSLTRLLGDLATQQGGYVETIAIDLSGRTTRRLWHSTDERLLHIEDDPTLRRHLIAQNPRITAGRIQSGRAVRRKTAVAAACWAQIDIDPARPPNCPATDAEREVAVETTHAIAETLVSRGYGRPWILFTGNGTRLLIHVPAVVGEAIRTFELGLKAWTRRIADRFDTDGIRIDLAAANTAALIPIPGTVNRKGQESPERLYKAAYVIQAGDHSPSAKLLTRIGSLAPGGSATRQTAPRAQHYSTTPAEAERCCLVASLVQRALQEGHLTHTERMILGTLGNAMGAPGREWVHSIMAGTANYNHRTTDTQLRSLNSSPYRCETIHRKLRELYGAQAPTRCPGCSHNSANPLWRPALSRRST